MNIAQNQPGRPEGKPVAGLHVHTDLRAGITIRIELPEGAAVSTVADTTTTTAAAVPTA